MTIFLIVMLVFFGIRAIFQMCYLVQNDYPRLPKLNPSFDVIGLVRDLIFSFWIIVLLF